MTITNREIAGMLVERARCLARSQENLYRIRSYRQAAVTLLGLDVAVAELFAACGAAAISNIPGIGKSLAATIQSYLECGKEVAASAR